MENLMEIDAYDFRASPLKILETLNSSTLGLSEVGIAGVRCFYVNDPALIHAMLYTQWPQFRKEFGYKKSRDLIQRDLFSPSAVWPSSDEFLAISANLQSIVSEYLKGSDSNVEDLYTWCRRLTMLVFMKTLLDDCIECNLTQQNLEDATVRIIRLLGDVILQFPKNIDTLDELDLVSVDELRDYAKLFKQHPTCEHATPARSMTTILAGYEQMATIMYWTIIYFAGRRCAPLPEIEDKHFLNEVIRLHSPIWALMRRPKGDVHLGRYTLPKDSVVITSPWLMARSPRFFAEPSYFKPERWNGQVQPFTFFPFSHGPRACKGERFVRATMYALLRELSSFERIDCDEPLSDSDEIRVSAIPSQVVRASFTR